MHFQSSRCFSSYGDLSCHSLPPWLRPSLSTYIEYRSHVNNDLNQVYQHFNLIHVYQHFKVNFPHRQTTGQSHLQHHRVRTRAEEKPQGGESDTSSKLLDFFILETKGPCPDHHTIILGEGRPCQDINDGRVCTVCKDREEDQQTH